MWLKPEDLSLSNGDPVATWPDATSNGNNATQSTVNKRPSYVSSSLLNGMPAVSFSGGSNNSTSDNLEVADDNSLDNTSGLVFYAAVRLNSIGSPNVQCIFGKRQSFSVTSNWAYNWYFYTGNRLFLDLNTSNNRTSTVSSFSNNTNYLLSMHYNGYETTASQRVRKFISGSLNATRTETSSSILNSDQNLYIGTMNNNYGKYFSGLMGDLMIFNDTLSSTQRILIDNYLSAKYNTSLTSNDLYTQDDGANGDYDFDVAGIGQNSDGTNNTDAQGTGIVRINNPSALANGEWLIWGHNNDALSSWGVTDLPSGIETRLERIWRVSETGEVGSVDLSIDLGAVFGPKITTDLRLLIDTDNDGLFDDETVGGGGVISGATNTGGSVYEWTSVNLDDNQRFTIGSINESQTPLPVELLSFEAQWQPKTGVVLLQWKTASEINNEAFVVEKSANGKTWTSLVKIDGAGTTLQQRNYETVDHSPNHSITYYRLKQIDYDGAVNYSNILKVNSEIIETKTRLYPNPASDHLILESEQDIASIRMWSTLSEVTDFLELVPEGEHKMKIDVSKLKPGLYYLLINDQLYPVNIGAH